MDSVNNFLKDLPDNTRLSYTKPLQLLVSRFNNADFKTINPDIVIKHVEENYETVSTKKQAFSAISSFLKHINHKDLELNKKTNSKYIPSIGLKIKELNDFKLDNIQPLKATFPKLEIIRQIWSEIDEDDIQDLRDKIILDFFINYEPLRSDIALLTRENYNEVDKTIYIPSTVKTLNEITINLNEKTVELLKEYLNSHNSDYLLDFNWTKRADISNFAKTLSRISEQRLGYKLTITNFRKLYTEYNEEMIKDLPKVEKNKARNECAKKMSHNTSTHLTYYDTIEREDEEIVKQEDEEIKKEDKDVNKEKDIILKKLEILRLELQLLELQ